MEPDLNINVVLLKAATGYLENRSNTIIYKRLSSQKHEELDDVLGVTEVMLRIV